MANQTGPSFYKGQLVKAVRPTGLRDWDFGGWRRCTEEETHAWYERLHEDCRLGRDVWHDSAGEPKLAPSDSYIGLVEGRVYQVLRGRVRAPCGYHSVKGAVELLCTHTGERFYVRRYCITHIEDSK